jgi:peptidoglycan/xylan/chitin deacetylase (PgdA/CDA1 family)
MAEKQYRWSLAEKFGGMVLLLAGLLSFIAPLWAVVLLSSFLVLCGAAPFFPGTGFYLPVISRGKPAGNSIALTFDDGPSPESTPIVLALLARYKLPATFFVIGSQAEQYPELIQRIVDEGHSVGNHSWGHDSLLMLRSEQRLAGDIRRTQEVLLKTGIRPLVFRPPVGITGPRLGPALDTLGMFVVNFSCRGFDRGNRNINNLADKVLKRLQPGDIVLLHDSIPLSAADKKQWQNELDLLLKKLSAQYTTVPLEDLTGRPVMEKQASDSAQQ